jgi:hypothetical protein
MRLTRLAVCLFLASFLVLAACQLHTFTAWAYNNTPPYTSFIDIAGITEDEIARITELQSRRTQFIYGMTSTTEAFYDESGKISGFSALFCVLLPGADIEGAMKVAEQIRHAVQSLIIQCEDGSASKVTISVGVHSLIPKVVDTIPELISKADHALYAAKDAGRNCIRQYVEK